MGREAGDGDKGYFATWQSPENIKRNITPATILLPAISKIAQDKGYDQLAFYTSAAAKSLATPGRGTLGGMTLFTTPKGIVLTDGYKFNTDPETINYLVKGNDSYSEHRRKKNAEYNADNTREQTYFIPWDKYYRIQELYGDK